MGRMPGGGGDIPIGLVRRGGTRQAGGKQEVHLPPLSKPMCRED